MQLKMRSGCTSSPKVHRNTRPCNPLTPEAGALHWQELIDGGKYASISDLAEALGLDRSYVSRIMRLALLAPDIVEAIVDGLEPSGLSLERLVKGMPVVWEEQRKAFGFPAA